MKNPKTFPLRVVLTVTTGRLLTQSPGPNDNGISDLYDILNHITGDSLFTHVLPRAGKFAKPLILKRYPELAVVEACLDKLNKWIASDRTPEKDQGVMMWLTELKMMFPEIKNEYEIEDSSDTWNSRNPIEELNEMAPGKPTIVVTL